MSRNIALCHGGFSPLPPFYLNFLGQPEDKLIPYKGAKFRVQQFSDVLYEFVVENGEVKALKERNPSGEYVYTRK